MKATHLLTLDELLNEQTSMKNRTRFLSTSTREYRESANRLEEVRAEILHRTRVARLLMSN